MNEILEAIIEGLAEATPLSLIIVVIIIIALVAWYFFFKTPEASEAIAQLTSMYYGQESMLHS